MVSVRGRCYCTKAHLYLKHVITVECPRTHDRGLTEQGMILVQCESRGCFATFDTGDALLTMRWAQWACVIGCMLLVLFLFSDVTLSATDDPSQQLCLFLAARGFFKWHVDVQFLPV